MAIDVNNARFLLSLKRNGIDFSEVATIGRQGLFIPPKLIESLFQDGGVSPAVHDANFLKKDIEAFSEPFFHMLGARRIVTMDYSDYEGASIIHDMNKPVQDSLKNKFDVLIDSGSIEHMFHFPQAIKNYMNMVKKDGYLILVNMPLNNHMGHGFFQFSPELFYNLLTEENGFEVIRLLVAEDFPYSQFYEVTHPKSAGERIGLCNDKPVLLFLAARKTKDIEEVSYPAQNDYVKSWSSGTQSKHIVRAGRLKKTFQDVFKGISLKEYFRFTVTRNWNLKKRNYSLSNNAFYRKVNDL